MKKSLLTLFSFLTLYGISLQAQIVITANDLLNVGESLSDVEAIVNPGISIGSPGANQTYNFSTLAPDDTTTTTFISPNGTPGFSAYPNATLASDFGEGFLYYQKTANEAFLLGSYIDTSENNMGQYIAVPFNPTQKIFQFPSTFNTAYTDTWAITVTFEDDSGFADSIRSTTTTTEDVLFDGFGTVITPEGSFNGLRERRYSATVNKTEVFTSGMWIPLQEVEFADTSYIWYAKESKGPLVTVDIDQGQISTATYALIGSVSVAPNAAFTFSDQGGGVVNFTDNSTNGPTSWLWDFGDGNTSTAQNPTHTFAGPGAYTVCLTATNSAGSNTTCSSVSILLAPTASFSFSDQGGGVVNFTDISTNDPTSWLWDFGDGNTSTAQNPTHTFAGPGSYTVCLTATNSAGSNTTCSSVTIVLAPVASFSSSDQGGGVVNFTDNSTNDPTSWLWDFGDGNTSTAQNPTHTFAAPGAYNVCLTATNSAGSNTTCSSVTIVLAPVAAFNFSVQEGGVVDFTDNSTNNPTSWLWDFSDGSTSELQNPQHTFTMSGIFNVCLTATNSAGSNMACQEVDAMVTSTNDIGHLINLTIAPNPVRDLLNVRLESDDFSQLRFRLINPGGQVVLERQLQSNQDHQFNLRELPQGTYFYLLTDEMGQLGSRGSIQKIE